MSTPVSALMAFWLSMTDITPSTSSPAWASSPDAPRILREAFPSAEASASAFWYCWLPAPSRARNSSTLVFVSEKAVPTDCTPRASSAVVMEEVLPSSAYLSIKACALPAASPYPSTVS